MNAEDRKRLEEIKFAPDFGAVLYPDRLEPSKAFEQANIMRDWLITHLEAAERRAEGLAAECRRLKAAIEQHRDCTYGLSLIPTAGIDYDLYTALAPQAGAGSRRPPRRRGGRRKPVGKEMGYECFARIYGDWYRGEQIEKHRKAKASWPWYGRLQHWLFCSWRCPACKVIKAKPHATEQGRGREPPKAQGLEPGLERLLKHLRAHVPDTDRLIEDLQLSPDELGYIISLIAERRAPKAQGREEVMRG